MNQSHHLRAVPIAEAYEMFFAARKDEWKPSTHRFYRKGVRNFIEWITENHAVEFAHEIDGFLIEKWKLARLDEVKPITVNGNMKITRQFIRWCESIDAIERGTAERMQLPKLDDEDEVNDDFLMPGMADRLLDYFAHTRQNDLDHARFAVMWHTGCRISGAVALDVSDYKFDEETGKHYLSFRDRPDTGTALKNSKKSERDVAIFDEEVVRILDSYIEYRRRPCVEDSGREPLFTTAHGRLSRQAAYKRIKRDSRPCKHGLACPIDREPTECEAAQYVAKAESCGPASSNHPIRKGAITHQLAHGVPKHIVSERCDVSIKVLEKHYDKRTEKIKMQTRLRSDNPFGALLGQRSGPTRQTTR